MRPLTDDRPKPLVLVCGKPLLAHIIDALPPVVDEVILVVGYRGEMIQEAFGDTYGGRRLRYVTQENPSGGTAEALFCTRPLITGKFLVMYGDDVHGARALAEVSAQEHGMLAAHSDTPERFGVLILNEDGTLKSIIENPKEPPSNLVNIGGFVLSPLIFDFFPPLSEKGEYFLTDSVTAYAAKYPLRIVRQDTWIPIGRPEDIPKGEAILCPKD